MSGRSFNMIAHAIWRSGRFLTVSNDAKTLLFYFMTGQHQTSCGAYRLPDGYAIADLRWSIEDYQTARQELLTADLIAVDAETSEIYVRRWFQHCFPKGKQVAGCRRLIEEIDSDTIRELVEEEFLAASDKPPEGKGDPLDYSANADSRLLSTGFMNGRR